jgi:hypothetical protein
MGTIIDPTEYGIDRFDVDALYMIVPDSDASVLSTRDFATINVILNISEDALYVPFAAVKRANGRVFAYVLTNGIRTIRDIEEGLMGNERIEIINGLEEGETVIIE